MAIAGNKWACETILMANFVESLEGEAYDAREQQVQIGNFCSTVAGIKGNVGACRDSSFS
jgi:hypothetical protein